MSKNVIREHISKNTTATLLASGVPHKYAIFALYHTADTMKYTPKKSLNDKSAIEIINNDNIKRLPDTLPFGCAIVFKNGERNRSIDQKWGQIR